MKINIKSQKPKNEISVFIRKFNFSKPDWELVPDNILDLRKENISRYEGHLLDAVKLAWMASGKGKKFLYTKTLKTFLLAISVFFILSFGANAIKNLEGNHTKSINAATISATINKIKQGDGMEIVESTMSAMFNKKE